jgi:hypothetical protein
MWAFHELRPVAFVSSNKVYLCKTVNILSDACLDFFCAQLLLTISFFFIQNREQWPTLPHTDLQPVMLDWEMYFSFPMSSTYIVKYRPIYRVIL